MSLKGRSNCRRTMGSLSGGVAAAFSGRETLTIDRKDITNVVSDHHCQIFISNGYFYVGLNLAAEEIATIGDAIKKWKSADSCLPSISSQ